MFLPTTDIRIDLIPDVKDIREKIRARVDKETTDGADSYHFDSNSLESRAKFILDELQISREYTAWTMVLLGGVFWRTQIETVPYTRRILLLPHCLRNSTECKAVYDSTGLHCLDCGKCVLSKLRNLAQSIGYKVIIAEGTPIVMQSILHGEADAILGVGCLKSLERAFEKLQLIGIPAAAIPLLTTGCKDTEVDFNWVRELIAIPYIEKKQTIDSISSNNSVNRKPTWLHLLRGATNLFDERNFAQIAPFFRQRLRDGLTDWISATEHAALDFLSRGGKFYRPFITLATFDALTGSHGTGENGIESVKRFPEIVKRSAAAIEVFHKASLVHDDIEDDDSFRYGFPTLHKTLGIPAAINVGDYLLGLGYRMIASTSQENTAIAADILCKLSEAHVKLCEGQGAELAWRQKDASIISPKEALKIYSLKTSPAFEAALYTGLRLGVEYSELEKDFFDSTIEPIAQFARYLGIAFQIKNDLDDWTPDDGNKRVPAQDIFGTRPTVLRAFATESLKGDELRELLTTFDQVRQYSSENEDLNQVADYMESEIVDRIRTLYELAEVFDKARQLIDKYINRAGGVADQIQHEPLRNLLHHLFQPLVRAS